MPKNIRIKQTTNFYLQQSNLFAYVAEFFTNILSLNIFPKSFDGYFMSMFGPI